MAVVNESNSMAEQIAQSLKVFATLFENLSSVLNTLTG